MTRTMYDALNTGGIPAGAEIAAWYPYDTRNHDGPPKAARMVLGIDNSSNGAHPDCHIADIEPGAMWPPSVAPGWVSECRQPFPTTYCDLDNTPALFGAMHGVLRVWYLWVAAWTQSGLPAVPSVPGLPASCRLIGAQYRNASAYDLSIVTADYWYPYVGAGPGPVSGPPPVYTVQPGDTLSAIAARYGMDWQELYMANQAAIGADPNLIHPGLHLIIPTSPPPAGIYVVEQGDSLTSIAAKFHLNGWDPLYLANKGVIGDNPSLIYPGQRLVIP